MMKSVFLSLSLGLISIISYAQCQVEAFADRFEICEGESVTIWAEGGCGLLMYNDFNNSTPGAGWQATTGVQFNNPCGPGPDAIHLWMGNQVPIPRTLTTIPFNVQGGGQIKFWMRFAIQGQSSPCEGPDEIDEGISLQYSTNGGTTWTDIVYFQPDGQQLPNYPGTNNNSVVNNGQQTPFTVWAHYTFDIPPAAQTTSTMFRWRQHAYTDMDYDHWGLDVVEIVTPQVTLVQWSHGPTVLNPPAVSPTQTTTYTVTVYDTINNMSAQDQITIVVHPKPNVSFTTSPVCEGQAMQFQNNTSSTAPITSYSWNFGDGNTSNQQHPSHTYNSFGTYDVTLQVVNAHNCTGQATQQVTVNANPVVQFKAEPTSGCTPLAVQFSSNVTTPDGSAITSYQWNFGNGNTASSQNPATIYQSSGQYTVILVATTEHNCQSQLQRPNYIWAYPKPIAEFTYTPRELFIMENTYFEDLSVGATSWLWNFGDEGSSTDQNPVFIFQVPGMYLVSLYVENQWGCFDQIEKLIQVKPNETIYIPNAFSPNDDNLNAYFRPYGIHLDPDKFQMRIFNRYGQLIFYSTNINNHWDGRDMTTGELVPQGFYVYYIKVYALDGRSFDYRGMVAVIY